MSTSEESSNKALFQKEFESGHESAILVNLNRDRNTLQEFCDLTLCIGQNEFPAHRCVLAVFSHFFRKMFTSQMQERFQKKVFIQTIEVETMETILNFIYTCKLRVNMDNVIELLYAAEYMQLPFIKNYCTEYLIQVINPENCVSILLYAERYNIDLLMAKAQMVISQRFELMVKEEEFKELSLDCVKRILQCKSKIVSSEIVVCNAILDWVKHRYDEREQHFIELFEIVKIEHLSRVYAKHLLVNEDLIMRGKTCVSRIRQSFLMRSRAKSFKRVKRESKHGILLLGGENFETKATKYELKQKKWKPLPNFNSEREASSVVKIGDEICIMGGKSNKSVEILNLKTNQEWVEVACMAEEREEAASAVCGGRIYVVGGKTATASSSSSGQCYCIEDNRWTPIKNMTQNRRGHALVSLDGVLYALGGCSVDDTSAECYNPVNLDMWRPILRMNTPRYGLAAVVLNYEIYAIGGRTRSLNGLHNLRTVEKYNIYTDIWCQVASMNEERRFHSACVIDSKIYVAGGNSKTVEVYDPLRDEWKIESEMEEKREFSCIVAV